MGQNSKQKLFHIAALAIILLGALVVCGTVYLFATNKIQIPQGLTDTGESKDNAEGLLALLEIKAPEFDLSLSPISSLKVSSFNLSMPSLPSGGIFSGISVDKNISYTGGNTSLSTPTVPFSFVPSSVQNSSQETPLGSQLDCSIFASVPNCSYVGASDSQSYSSCKQCYPEK